MCPLTRIPTITPGQRPDPSTQPSIKREKNHKRKPAKDYAMKPTFDIPLGSNSTSAKRTSPARFRSSAPNRSSKVRGVISLTLSHEILKMVPLDIVRKIADVDPAVLLRGLANVIHHLFSSSGPFLIRSVRNLSRITCALSSTWSTCASHGRAVTSSSVIVPTR